MKPREFAIYCGADEKCLLKEEGLQPGRRFDDIAQAIDFILTLDLPPGSMLTAYDAAEEMFRIPV